MITHHLLTFYSLFFDFSLSPTNVSFFAAFLLPAEPPSFGPDYETSTFRQRIKGWNDSIVGDLNAFPYIVFVYYSAKIYLFIWLFMNKIANPNVGFFDEDNVKRMIIYNIIGDVTGFNSTGGPLGFRMVAFFVTWYNLFIPGSLTCPLIPGVPAKRHWLQSVGYVTYLYFLYMALAQSELLTFNDIAPIVGVLAVLTPFDLITFQASRGEHSGKCRKKRKKRKEQAVFCRSHISSLF